MLNIVTIAGPIVLAIILFWALTHNRRTRRERQLTEEATRRNYKMQDAADKAGGRIES